MLIMPASYSLNRRIVLQAPKAEVHLTDPLKVYKGVIENAEEILNKTTNGYLLRQCENPANPKVFLLLLPCRSYLLVERISDSVLY